MSLCPEADKRAAMDDGEFWDYVFNQEQPEYDDTAFLPDVEEFVVHEPSPCPECGSFTACAYDVDGRPMVHVVEDDDASD